MPQPRALRDPVTIYLDGEAIPAEAGEPVAVALIAAGRLAARRACEEPATAAWPA
jgi:sarcosine oxidase, subunit alpha